MNKKASVFKRRDLLAAAGASSLLAACGQAGEQGEVATGPSRKPIKLRMTTAWPKNFPGLGTAAERLAKRIDDATGGRVKISVFAAGELAPALEAFDAVSSGAADIYHGAEYYWQGKNLAFNFFTGMPFGMTFPEQNAWIHHGGGQALWDELSSRFNIKALMAANTGTQMGGWFARPINSPADLRGLKIRIPGLGGAIYRKLGAAAVTLAGGDIFPAMQSGKIDAAEWIGPWNDLAFGFHQIASVCHWPGFHEPGAVLAMGINLDLWNEFDAATQAIIKHAAAAENIFSYAEFTYQNAQGLATLRNRHNVRFLPFPPSVLDGFRRATDEILQESAAQNEYFAKVHASYQAWRKTGAEWMTIAERGFLNARDS